MTYEVGNLGSAKKSIGLVCETQFKKLIMYFVCVY